MTNDLTVSSNLPAAMISEDKMDTLCRQLTAFASFRGLLTAAAGYRPSIRLDLLGHDGKVLAEAYDRAQFSGGDPRRAFVTGEIAAASIEA